MEKGQSLIGFTTDSSSIYTDIVDLQTRTQANVIEKKNMFNLRPHGNYDGKPNKVAEDLYHMNTLYIVINYIKLYSHSHAILGCISYQ